MYGGGGSKQLKPGKCRLHRWLEKERQEMGERCYVCVSVCVWLVFVLPSVHGRLPLEGWPELSGGRGNGVCQSCRWPELDWTPSTVAATLYCSLPHDLTEDGGTFGGRAGGVSGKVREVPSRPNGIISQTSSRENIRFPLKEGKDEREFGLHTISLEERRRNNV